MHFLQISSQDVKGCMSTAEISKQLNLQSIRKHKYQIQPCCALTGEGYVKFLTCLLANTRIAAFDSSSWPSIL